MNFRPAGRAKGTSAAESRTDCMKDAGLQDIGALPGLPTERLPRSNGNEFHDLTTSMPVVVQLHQLTCKLGHGSEEDREVEPHSLPSITLNPAPEWNVAPSPE